MGQGFGTVSRNVKRMQRIVYSILIIMVILITASMYVISTSIEDNGGVHNTLVKIIRESKPKEFNNSLNDKQ